MRTSPWGRAAVCALAACVSTAATAANEPDCQRTWGLPGYERTLTFELKNGDLDLTPWCDHIYRFAAVRGHPWPEDLHRQLEERLEQAGIFAAVACERRAPRAVHCVFTPRQVVMEVDVSTAPFPLLERDVERHFYLHRGAPVPEGEARRQLVERLREYLEGEGFLEPKITINTEVAPLTGEPAEGVKFVIGVTETEGRELGRVDTSNTKLIPIETARDAVEHEWIFGLIDRRFRPEAFHEDIESLQQKLREDGWPELVIEGVYAVDPFANKVDVYLQVEAGRRLSVKLVGGEDIDHKPLYESMQFARVGAIDTLACERSARAMQRRLQEAGYHGALVTCELEIEGAQAEARFLLEPGQVARVQGVEIIGNRSFDDPVILSEAGLVTPRSAWFSPPVWVDEVVEEDVVRVRAFYVERGFAAAEVEASKQVLPSGDLQLRLQVQEGPKTRVGKVILVVDDPEVEVGFIPKMGAGAPFVESGVNEQRRQLARILANRGYLDVAIESTVEPAEPGRVNIVHHISPGAQRYFGGLLITGAVDTSHSLLRREIGLSIGEVVTLEEIQRAERRLYDLRVFSSVELEPVFGKTGEPLWMRLDVREHDTFYFDVAAGFSTDDLFVLGFDAHHGNLLGYAIWIDASLRFSNASEFGVSELRIGNRDEALLAIRAPHPFNAPFDVHLEGSYTFQAQDIYFARELSATLALSRVLMDPSTCRGCPRLITRGGYRLSATDITLPQPLLSTDPLLSDATAGRLFVEGELAQVDSLVDPRRGYRTGLLLELAHPYLAPFLTTNAAFYRTAWYSSAMYPFDGPVLFRGDGGKALTGPFVIAGALDLGWAGPWPGQGVLPLPETFFYGGDQSLRGALPRASLVAEQQGRFLFRTSAELRWYFLDNLAVGAFQIALFTDVGTVSRYLEDLFAVTTVSIGVALRYITPIGPLSLAYGLAVLRPREIVDVRPEALPSSGRVHFTFGPSF